MDIKPNNVVLFQNKPVCVFSIGRDGKVIIAKKEDVSSVICLHIVDQDNLSEYICPKVNGPCTFTRNPAYSDIDITCMTCETHLNT